MVAWKSLKTPTAVADYLVEHTMECENRIIDMAGSLTSAVTDALSSAGEQISSMQNRISATTRLIVRVKREQVNYHTATLRRSSASLLRSAKEETGRLENALRHLDPAGVMRRGFTLTAKNGLIVRSLAELEPGDTITTHFETGQAASTVKKITQKR